ncbi:MAG: hypothetical protein WCL06_11940 [Bacteroidota bacterium]
MKKIIFTILLSLFATSLSWSQVVSSNSDVTKKGNKVFLEFSDAASLEIQPYLIESLNKWGYWDIVTTKAEAQFVIAYVAESYAGEFSVANEFITRYGHIVIKTLDGQELQRSKKMKGNPAAYNGYKGIKDLANKIVKKYLMVGFK